uniref:Uncharacterized protein n=1 Tax=Arundo donax TaxID=35708 RepID=A0A0A9GSG4_ARUDO
MVSSGASTIAHAKWINCFATTLPCELANIIHLNNQSRYASKCLDTVTSFGCSTMYCG